MRSADDRMIVGNESPAIAKLPLAVGSIEGMERLASFHQMHAEIRPAHQLLISPDRLGTADARVGPRAKLQLVHPEGAFQRRRRPGRAEVDVAIGDALAIGTETDTENGLTLTYQV